MSNNDLVILYGAPEKFYFLGKASTPEYLLLKRSFGTRTRVVSDSKHCSVVKTQILEALHIDVSHIQLVLELVVE